jgi:hypothetical protein
LLLGRRRDDDDVGRAGDQGSPARTGAVVRVVPLLGSHLTIDSKRTYQYIV